MKAASRIDPATGLPHATRTLWSVQVLRGVAALMIVVGHVQTVVALSLHDPAFRRSTLLPWGASVDLFFVVSGFVMVHASRRLFGTATGAPRFLARRLARVVPLYWLATAAMLVLLAIGSWKGGDRFPAPMAIAASFAFVPFDTWGDGALFPVLDLGWTLNYELFFYLVFALFVALPRRVAVTGVATAIAALAVGGGLVRMEGAAWFWSRPIMIDFVLGVMVGAMVAEGWVLPRTARLALGLAGLLVFAADPLSLFATPPGVTVANDWPRVLWAGVPCATILAAATLGPEPPLPGALRPAAALGDASYSLYLLHPFALIVVEKLIQKSPLVRRVPGEALAVAAVALAVLVALAAFRTIERPVTAWLTRRLGAAPRPDAATPLRRRAA